MGGATLLDRPDEVLAGLGFDFPVNKHFQPIAEVRSTYYRGGTDNAFHNNPVEVLGGAKIYPKRWFGFGFWYRRQLNQQDARHFNGANVSTVQINNLSGVFVPGRGIIIVPGFTAVGVGANGVPLGFRLSEDPNGFGLQVFAGHRNKRTSPIPPNLPPTGVSATASSSLITRPCPEGTSSSSQACPVSANYVIQLTASASDNENDVLMYTWTVTGGKISGEGKNVTWDLTGSQPGSYTATVQVSDGTNAPVPASANVTIADCKDCVPPPCPAVNVSCPADVEQGAPITFTASVNAGNVTYNWSVSAGTITGGQGTSSITVDTAGLGGQTVTATVEVGGLAAACTRTASCSTAVRPKVEPKCSKLDEYGNIKFNDEKARLDAFASALQSQPGSQGYIVGSGACEGEGLARANRAKDYLVNTRGIDAGRVTVVDGGCRAELWVTLYVCEPGAPAPTAATDGAVSPCPECKVRRPVRRHPARHGKKKATDDDDE
jgi:PKD-like domain/PKD domain